MEHGSTVKKQSGNYYLSLAISAFLLCIAVYFFSQERGVLQTVPLIFIVPPLTTLLFPNKKILLFFVGIFAILFSLVEKSDIKYTILYTVICLVYAFLGILVKSLIVISLKSEKSKKSRYSSFSALLTVMLVFSYVLLCGNTYENVTAQNSAKRYVKYSSFTDKIKIVNTYYNYTDGRYYTRISFHDGEYPVSAELSTDKKRGNIDGYQNYIEDKMTNFARAELSGILQNQYSETDFASRNGKFTKSSQKPLSLKDNYKEYYSNMSFDIAFYSLFSKKEQFLKVCKDYYNTIEKEGFQYHTITFYGGDTKQFLYQMTVKNGLRQEDLDSLVIDFDANHYKRYKNEGDLREHWN